MDMVVRNRTVKLIGIEKEEVEEQVEEVRRDHPKVQMDVQPLAPKIYVVLSAEGETEEEAKGILKPAYKALKKQLEKYIYSTKEAVSLEMTVVELLEKHDLTISTAESCTGGLLAGRLINVPGVSEVYKEGFVTYTNKSKRKTLDVGKSTLKKYGAVSSQTAKEMAFGAAIAADTDVSLSVTGIAGPDGGTSKKPVGLVYFGCFIRDNVYVEEHHFTGDRLSIRKQAVVSALGLLRRCIMENFG